MLSQLRPWVNGASKRMRRPVGTPAPLPIDELKTMYARRARVAQQMAAKAAAKAHRPEFIEGVRNG